MSLIDYYVFLLGDRPRVAAFERAIRAAVRPGDRVVDVGCGIGTFALMAARAGASRVDAIEINPTAAALARELGIEKESGGRVRVITGDAAKVRVGAKADVVIFEDFGGFGFFPGIRELLSSVRARLAAPGARYLPRAIHLKMAATDAAAAPVLSAGRGLPFSRSALERLRKRALNEPTFRRPAASEVATSVCSLGSFEVGRPLPPVVRYEGKIRARRSARLTGLIGWTALDLPRGGRPENAPGRAGAAWSSAHFPFEQPLGVSRGETLRISVEAAFGPGPKGLIWRWAAEGRRGVREGCSINALPADPAALKRLRS